MKNYFEEFYTRYETLKTDLKLTNLKSLTNDDIKYILENNAQSLNNLIMAGLGMGTLYLRMGAVLMIAEKIKPENELDVSFLKVIADKLIYKLPNDGEWKDIWNVYLSKIKFSRWSKIVDSIPHISGLNGKIFESFVTFRNNFVHQEVVVNSGLNDSQIEVLAKGLKTLEGMSYFREIFKDSILNTGKENNDQEVFFQYNRDDEKLNVFPFIQINKNHISESIGELPYLFLGLYYNGTKFINTEGAETEEVKDIKVEKVFEKIKNDIAHYNGDKAFDFDEKIKIYNDWCIGRDKEVGYILDWIEKSDIDKNVLPIFAPAGLGKGALVAKVIEKLIGQTPVMYHFCGSGNANNLQSIIYHLIIQGKTMPGMDGAGIWKLDESVIKKINHLSNLYTDTILLFQSLLKEKYKPIQKFENKPLVIIIDGLDEAAVSDQSKKITDWFYTYDDKGEKKEKWKCPTYIKWIFTYRQTSKENKEGFQFDYHEFKIYDLSELQPLKGLSEEDVLFGLKENFKEFVPTLNDDFIKSITSKGLVK
jgi:hypothetical protein